ncbi:hypothetical protein EU545_01895 [Candidatus Thorarchaeota archaeon]|nr:MAG: hypothetical protein EU545_01895 [Candidatus Thorarchaeota archaeon]
MTGDKPQCPFCDTEYQGSMQGDQVNVILECGACRRRYEFVSGAGCFPIEEDFAVRVSDGLLGPRVSIGGHRDDSKTLSRTRRTSYLAGALCCIILAILFPFIASIVTTILG